MEAKQYATKQQINHWRNQIKIFKYLEENENIKVMIQNLWFATKVVLRGKFIAIQSYLRKQEKSPINNLNLHLK